MLAPPLATIVVVGAGLSGLTSVLTLISLIQASPEVESSPSHPPTRIHVLEASAAPGGRLKSDCGGADLGAAWSWPTDRRLHSLAKELNVSLLPQPWEGIVSSILPSNQVTKHPAREGEVACGEGGLRFQGGAHSLVEGLVREIESRAAGDPRVNVTMHAGSACTGVAEAEAGTGLEVRASSNATQTDELLAADAVILALPPHAIAAKIQFEPPLPQSLKDSMLSTQVSAQLHRFYYRDR
jgi:monoamine oxidase